MKKFKSFYNPIIKEYILKNEVNVFKDDTKIKKILE